jgi:hypothetical protein
MFQKGWPFCEQKSGLSLPAIPATCAKCLPTDIDLEEHSLYNYCKKAFARLFCAFNFPFHMLHEQQITKS